MSGRSPPLHCALILITMHSHQSYPNITTVMHMMFSYQVVFFFVSKDPAALTVNRGDKTSVDYDDDYK